MSEQLACCKDQVVLVTGGTRGLGKAIAIEFMRAGAKAVYVTHKWGSVSEEELFHDFIEEGLPTPVMIESDIGDKEATIALMQIIYEQSGKLDTIISNVAFSKPVHELEDWKKQTLEISIRYSAWSIVELIQAQQTVMNNLPKYVIAVSSDGPDLIHPGYGLIGTAKAALETICRYLAVTLKDKGTKINVIRPGYFETESSKAAFGAGLFKHSAYEFLNTRSAAKAFVALCSGLMDCVTGQILTVDNGQSLMSPVYYLKKSLEQKEDVKAETADET